MTSLLHRTFWSEWFWLPRGTTWEEIAKSRSTGGPYPEAVELLYALGIGVAIVIIRMITERTFLQKLGTLFGVRNRSLQEQPPCPELDASYQKLVKGRGQGQLTFTEVKQIAADCKRTTRQVERWLRRKQHKTRTNMDKFKESGWRALCYSGLWILGASSIMNKPWVWNLMDCWKKELNQPVDYGIWWYYMLSMGLYCSFIMTQFFDVKRKDFWVMFAHHVIALGLLGFSWITNLTRMGSLIVFLHDTADIPLEVSKVLAYTQFTKLAGFLGAVFAFVWFLTRLVIYPLYTMRSTMFESLVVYGPCPMYYVLNFMLAFLLVMHVIWTYYICKFLYNSIVTRKLQDSRSSTDEGDNEIHGDDDKKTN